MATNNEREFLGRDGTEQLVAKVIALLSNKQDKGDYASMDDVSAAISELKYAEVSDDGNGNVSVTFGSNLSYASVQAYIDEKLGVIENGSY